MKHKLWLFQIPTVLLFTFAFFITDEGIRGHYPFLWVRNHAFSSLRSFSGWFTNQKFMVRGPRPRKNNIIIVAIDEPELAQYGRWPWHRDQIGQTVERIFQLGAKVVGLDAVFAEPDKRVSDDLKAFLEKNNLGASTSQFETDPYFAQVIAQHKDQLVLGWASRETSCMPAFADPENDCTADVASEITDLNQKGNEENKILVDQFSRTGYDLFKPAGKFDPLKTPLISSLGLIPNQFEFTAAANQAGYFSSWPDSDGYVRRTNLAMMVYGQPYPSLPLAMARAGTGKNLELRLAEDGRISYLGFSGESAGIPVSPLGAMEINFRGPTGSFRYIGVTQLFHATQDGKSLVDSGAFYDSQRSPAGEPASEELKEQFKDAYVLIGATALGINDRRPFPYDANEPGTEGLATILDNILAMDMLTHGSKATSSIWLFALMTLGALSLAYWAERLESVPALLMCGGALCVFAFFDQYVLFNRNNIDWTTGFFYTEMACVFMLTLAAKYVMEERNKKFIKGAFGKYVSPAIIDSIMKDPTKLTVGGEKKDLTILFSDIRGFTTFSERLDAPQLAKFLNDYLGIMTDLVFEHEGTLDKYIGDAVMAFWGAPLDQPRHAYNSCMAAIKMQQALDQHRPRFKEVYGIQVDIGIGLNSGPVNVGNMGSERIFEYTVIGDHVNLASRLEGLTKYYGVKIVTTRFTFNHIAEAQAPLPAHRVLDLVKVKGKKQAVELIEVLTRDYPAEGLQAFAEARQLYARQKWDDAIAGFEKAAGIIQQSLGGDEDYPCRMYLDRCVEFKQTPPKADWDGSWEMHSK